jgi:DNA replication and repair protein RecF
MYLTHIALTDFRNFSRLDIDIPRGALVLVGDNAQGKTSLLEAIYFISTFTSFQARRDQQLINFIAGKKKLAVGRIVADYVRAGKPHRLEVRIIQEAQNQNGNTRVRKEIFLDGLRRKANEAIGHFNAVLFLPQMLQVVEGPPAERRRYFNLILSQTIPNYAAYLATYSKSVSQRNALLKQLSERGGDRDQLVYWDDQVSRDGSFLIEARIQALQEIEHLAALVHLELTRNSERLRLDYQPAYDPVPKSTSQLSMGLDAPVNRRGFSRQEIQVGFQKALAANRLEEIARGQTTLGPHRDEVRFLVNSIDLGTFGSRGQVRTAMLSMKIAEITWIQEKTGHWPVLLLDEVLAELDPQRREDLLTRLSKSEQALLTTTDLDLFSPGFIKKAQLWQVDAGQVKPQTPQIQA